MYIAISLCTLYNFVKKQLPYVLISIFIYPKYINNVLYIFFKPLSLMNFKANPNRTNKNVRPQMSFQNNYAVKLKLLNTIWQKKDLTYKKMFFLRLNYKTVINFCFKKNRKHYLVITTYYLVITNYNLVIMTYYLIITTYYLVIMTYYLEIYEIVCFFILKTKE